MDEAVFLIVLGAFAILYAVGWLAIGLPKRERRGMLNRGWLTIRRAIVASGVVPLRGP
jgi:hypothetical protein